VLLRAGGFCLLHVKGDGCVEDSSVGEFWRVFDPTLAIRLVVGLYRFMQRRVQVMGSTDWPMGDGRITDIKIFRDELQGWAVEITYFYVALGEYYSGKYRRSFRRKKSAQAFLERLPPQTAIPVRYKPQKAEVSALLMTDMSLLLAGL
jgi:hypothetical protein